MTKRHLTRPQQYAANKLIEANGIAEVAEDGNTYFTYAEGWNDQRVAEVIGIPVELVRNLRQDVHGLTRPSRQAPSSPLDYLTLAKRLQAIEMDQAAHTNRLDALEQLTAAHSFDLAKQASLISHLKILSDKDCDRLNTLIVAIQDFFKSMGQEPIDFSKAWPPEDWPKVVSLPPDTPTAAIEFIRGGKRR